MQDQERKKKIDFLKYKTIAILVHLPMKFTEKYERGLNAKLQKMEGVQCKVNEK